VVRPQLTILMVGKNGVGKSSTCNSIMGEKVFAASAFQAPQTGEPQMVSRQASGFTLRVIEAPGLLDGDTVHEEHLNALGEFVSDKVIDAVLYVDRLDTYRLQTTDTQIMEALTSRFGTHVWDITTFVLTHGNVPPPSGFSYEQFVARRHDVLKVLPAMCPAT
jgi:predicted GTPase